MSAWRCSTRRWYITGLRVRRGARGGLEIWVMAPLTLPTLFVRSEEVKDFILEVLGEALTQNRLASTTRLSRWVGNMGTFFLF